MTEAPYEIRATTRDATNDFSAPEGACEGFTNEKGTGSNDHVYRFTPPVAGVYTVKTDSRFDSATYIVSDCSSVAASCVIGDDSWTGEFKVNLSPPGPYYIIVDGHSITSNVRGSYTLTISEPCMPECAGKQCGPDGCGAACGQCAEAELCGDDGQCYPPESVPGNTCANAFDVTSIPFEKAGDSKIGTNLYQTAIGSCPPDGEGVGAKSPDHVFRFTPTVSGTYKITLENESWNGTFYVSTDCSNISGTCAYEAADSFYMDEVADVTLFSGQTYFIIVDGESSSVSSGGEYVLKIDEPCIQQCAGKQCGDDGCGASCGTCPGEQLCTEEGQCVDREAIPGNTCGEAFTVGPLPFTGTGDTSVGEDVYSFPQNACPQSYSGKGAASRDHVYLFNPPADGDYEIKLDATFDSALYVATDCAQIDKTCLAGADVSGPETLVLNLNAGITFYIFVDGWSNSTDLHGSYTLTVKKR